MDHTPPNSRQAMRQAWKTGSPFQARKSSQRPKLRFKSPIETDTWLCEREKTDYTYARSASYSTVVAKLKSLEELAISYITPILSRRSREPVMRPDDVPVTPIRTPRRRIQMDTPGSTRRSERLASKRHSRHVATTTTETSTYSAYGSTDVHADDSSSSPRSSISNGATVDSSWRSRNSHNYTESGANHINNRSFSERLHASKRDKYIKHMYGLDQDDYDGEYSDTESSLAATRSSFTTATSASTWETHHCHDDYDSSSYSSSSTLSSSITSVAKSALTYPLYAIYRISTTVLTLISTLLLWPVAAVFSTVKKSSDVSSVSHSIYSLLSRCVHFTSVLLYRFFTSILLWDVWALTRIRELFLGFLGFGMATTASALSSSSSFTTVISESERLERNRRRRGCCLLLLILLLLPFFLYLLMGAAPILLAALSKNETKVEETIDESAFFAASGCMKCIKKDQLTVLIGAAVKDQVKGLHSQIEKQNQRILMLQQGRAEYESRAQTLTDQLALLLSKQETPSKETLVYINSLETELTSLRGELRNLQMDKAERNAEQNAGADKERMGMAALGVLRTDIGNMEETLAALKADLKNFHGVYNADVYKLETQDRHLHGDVNIIGSRVLALEKRVSSDAHSLERRLSQLQQALQGFESGSVEDRAHLDLMATQIGVVEGNMTVARSELRELRADLAAALLSAEKVKELEDKMALNVDVQVLQTQLTELQSQQTDGVKDLQDLDSRYKTVYSSVSNIQTDITELHESVQDIDANKYGAIILSLTELQSRLSDLEKNSKDLRVNMQHVQDASSDKVDASLVAGLRDNFSELEAKLNHVRTEVHDLGASFNGKLDDAKTEHDRHKGSTAAMFGTINEDIAALQESSKDTVSPSTLDVNLNSIKTDVQKSSGKLSADIGSLRTELRTLEQVEGGSQLVGDVTRLQAVLESVRTQLQGLDTSNTGASIEPTVAVDLAELRSGVEQTARDVRRNQASLSSINGTIVILQQGHQEQVDSNAVMTKDLDKLRDELSAMMLKVDELSAAGGKSDQKLSDKIQLEASALQSHLQNVQFDVESLQHQLAQLSAKSAMKKDYEALVDNVSSLRAAVLALQQQFVSESGGEISIIQLVDRVSTLGALVDKYEDSGTFAGGAGAFNERGGDAVETEKLQGSLDGVQDELARLQRDLGTLNSAVFITDQDGSSQSVLSDIASQLSNIEASLEGLRTSQQGINSEVDRKIGAIESLMGTLKDQLIKMQSDMEDSDMFGAAAGQSVRDDLIDVKGNLSDLNDKQIKLIAEIKECCNKSQLAEIWAAGGYSETAGNLTDSDGLNEERVKNIVISALTLFSADKTGKVDYALESAGGSVVSTRCSETYTPRTALVTIMGIPLWYHNSSPRMVIQPDMNPGNCWAFKGSEGYLVIQLSGQVKATAFSMEHIPKTLSPSGNIDSAPREFSVWSMHNEYDTEGTQMGKYEYNQDGNPLQFFAVHDPNAPPTGMVELRIHSNHGNPEYTCLYRFRVHGTLHKE